MPRTRHYATAPNGQKFTRTSQSRTYSHMVAGQRSKETALRWANSQGTKDQDGKNWDYANSKVTGARDWYKWESEESVERDHRHVAEGRENYIDRKHRQRLEAVEAIDFTKWIPLGWSGRLDLAQKVASPARAKDYWARVEIFEAHTF